MANPVFWKEPLTHRACVQLLPLVINAVYSPTPAPASKIFSFSGLKGKGTARSIDGQYLPNADGYNAPKSKIGPFVCFSLQPSTFPLPRH
jgi:hypothetical protein